MSSAQDTATLIEGFQDDDCTSERTGADWFRAREIPLPTLGRPAEPARELAAAIREAAARARLLEDTTEELVEKELLERKRRELLISVLLFSMICFGSVLVILFGGNPLFWTPIALGSFGVCGSSALYLSRLGQSKKPNIRTDMA